MLRIGFLASHNGSNMQSVVRACHDGKLNASPRIVISNNANAGALAFAREQEISWAHLSSKTHVDPDELDAAILSALCEQEVALVLLVGYMRLLGPRTVRYYSGRILNIHPALLPKFGGKGMYGMRVQEAVLAARERVTGVTIHLANERYDEGDVIAQSVVPVLDGDTPELLSRRVLQEEHRFLVETLAKIAAGNIILPGLVSHT